jgi:hypothetical protein
MVECAAMKHAQPLSLLVWQFFAWASLQVTGGVYDGPVVDEVVVVVVLDIVSVLV